VILIRMEMQINPMREAGWQDAGGGAYCCGEVADGEIGTGTGRRWGCRVGSGGKGKVQH
jgi:hypothetical protein